MAERCEICDQLKEKLYECPKCSIHFCSVCCYRSEKHVQCSEKFYQGCVEEELKAQKFESSIKNRNTIPASLNEEISRQSARESLFRIFPDADLDAVDESELDRELFQMGVNVNDDIFELLDDEQKEEFQKIWRKYLKKNFASSVATESSKSFSSMPSGNEIIAEVNEQIKNHSHGRLFAIVKFGDEQFKVTEEDIIIVQGSYPFKVGDKIRLEKILCVGSIDFTLFGTPVLPKEKVAVNATVIEKTFSNVDVDFFFVRRKDIRRLSYATVDVTIVLVN
ncbi:39S ribosomal protein L21, mitochondrial [Trichinella britovi]|uniref:Large ribosomal subunit protein bL21m n=2 Tax=Trichinella TaxID=6333 RepID=A0A0V1DAX8_TRIBR|nr:39S ribosomal protein L21, mitochondrial [Trichinella murrelli]KRY58516.1 39S ribosomal protein L21, mitochondrial [Trichinella britovi]